MWKGTQKTMNKNKMTDINTAIALTRCDLNTTNILNNISAYSTGNISSKQIDMLWDAIEYYKSKLTTHQKL